ncbi:MAG: PadR family transcriptional regulator [Candidatus Thorarchaeota archaeon]|jgi:DNA-binding PadR family transcriptional regulator
MKKHELTTKILLLIGYEEIHGYDLHKEIVFRGTKISQSRLYSILADMVSDGLLTKRWETSKHGPRKKMFTLSETGLELRMNLLIEAVESVHRFYMEYLGRLPQESNFFDQIWSALTKKPREKPRVAVLIGHISQTVRYIISRCHNHFSDGVFYILKNPDVDLEDIGNDWLVLDGIYNNLPLKDEYLDLLVVVGFHKTYADAGVVQEWFRMIKNNGTLAVMASAIQTSEPETPLSLGDYIEFYQHHNHGALEDWIVFKKWIGEHSKKIVETEMAEICLFQAQKKM